MLGPRGHSARLKFFSRHDLVVFTLFQIKKPNLFVNIITTTTVNCHRFMSLLWSQYMALYKDLKSIYLLSDWWCLCSTTCIRHQPPISCVLLHLCYSCMSLMPIRESSPATASKSLLSRFLLAISSCCY